MALLGEVGSPSDDIIAAVSYLHYESCFAIGPRCDAHTVAYSHGIGAANTLQAEVPFHLTLKSLAAVRQDHVPASCVPYYKSLLSHQLRRSLFPWSLLPAGRR